MKERVKVLGKKFGRLTPIKRIDRKDKHGINLICYLCKCDCGNEVILPKQYFTSGYTKSCGCLKNEKARERKMLRLEGKRFGKLVVIEFVGFKNHLSVWKCKCDCGNEKNVIGAYLTNGETKSCGCLQKEVVTTHGGSNSKLYQVYQSMIQRCCNKKAQEYERYGGRGITVCKLWLSDFANFRKWAMKNGYKEGLTIDRVNNDGNYCPENCKWSTMKEQAQNRSTNVFIEYKGIRLTLSRCAELLGMKYPTFEGYYRKNVALKHIKEFFENNPSKDKVPDSYKFKVV